MLGTVTSVIDLAWSLYMVQQAKYVQMANFFSLDISSILVATSCKERASILQLSVTLFDHVSDYHEHKNHF